MKKLVTAAFLSFTLFSQAQINDKDVLFTLDGTPIMATEFIRVYNKNLDLVKDESQKDIDGYLNLFINYQLKVKEARRLGLHEDANYIREFNNYKKQLTKNYMSDNQVTDDLVKEAYERITNDVKASHILIRLDENETDTLEVYNQLLKLRERVINEGYSKVQKDVHNGSTVFAEDLGYFGGFKMVYPFENAAFNTPVGEVSMPFRTRFGYHIVKVFEKRKSLGQVTVAHIMVSDKQNDSLTTPETRINQIYKKLQQGEKFESLAKQFSDDKSSSRKGGVLSPFTGGQLSSKEFEEVAFSLENSGDISKPFKSDFGWHIIKLINKKGIQPFEEVQLELQNKVKRDSRSALITSAMVNKLAKKYNVIEFKDQVAYFESIITDEYFKQISKPNDTFEADKPILKIGDETILNKVFFDFLMQNQRKYINRKVSPTVVVQKEYQAFYQQQVLKYHEEHLEFENEDFAFVLKEYRDGLLLFELMEQEVWNAAAKDTVGLKNFYEAHKSDYVWEDRADGIVISSASKSVIQNVKKALEKGSTVENIMTMVNTGGDMNALPTKGVFEKGNQALPEDFEFEEGISKIYEYNDAFHVVKVNSVLPAGDKTLEEAKGKVISDYQNFIEENWVQTLNERFKVNLNEEVLERIKQHILNN